MALRCRDGARVIQLASGCMPMISECACWAICLIKVARYASGIQSRGSIRSSAASIVVKRSLRRLPPVGARVGQLIGVRHTRLRTQLGPTDRMFG